MLRVTDIFASYQGEGELLGTPSVFIRLAGCNLRCWYCDTPYASWNPEGNHLDLLTILEQIQKYDISDIIITGGEPMLQPEIVPLTFHLKQLGYRITVETAATIDRLVLADLMSISPKRANSTPQQPAHWKTRHEAERHQPAVIHRFLKDYHCQVKFVIDHPEDINDVLLYLEEFPELQREQIYLMPQSRTPDEVIEHEAWLIPLATQHGLNFTSRKHILEFGNTRCT